MIQRILNIHKIFGLYYGNYSIYQNKFFRDLEDRIKLTKEMVQNRFQPRAQYNRNLKEIYRTSKENLNNIIDMLRKQRFPHGNYIGLGNLVNLKH